MSNPVIERLRALCVEPPGTSPEETAACVQALVDLYADRLEFTSELPDELQILFPHLPDDLTRLDTTAALAAEAMAMAGAKPSELGLLEAHDCFTITGLLTLEAERGQVALLLQHAGELALHVRELALGGSLENAVVMDEYRVLNEDGLRYRDEFVKHKILDAIGDLYLLGHSSIGAFSGYRSGHALNNKLLKALCADKSAWEEVTFDDPESVPVSYAHPAQAVA